jgi:arabinan endo-1,5-alpha-L-arabinosidase
MRCCWLTSLLLLGCGMHGSHAPADLRSDPVDAASSDAMPPSDPIVDMAAATTPCTTRVTYGAAWIHPAQHPDPSDVGDGLVTWDGACTDDGANSYAILSNGWKPYFGGHGACVLALDSTGCAGAPSSCGSRVSYGAAWQHPSNHAAQFDDVGGRLVSDENCRNAGATSSETLSNGWTPTFSGAGACELSFRYTQCGGLYANPVIPVDCPDPGVVRDGATYYLSCTSGDAGGHYPIYVSTDLASWTRKGYIFPSGHAPSWATGDFWAPEIHRVGSGWVAYFSARHSDGTLAVGAASASSPLGPFVDRGAPLVHKSGMGTIDASEFTDGSGAPYLLWKDDGNAASQATPIWAQPLAADGLSRVGAPTQLITNDQSWEGVLVEGPFMVRRGNSYYLFYSGNAYYDTRYAVGVARADAPLGPFIKAAAPIVVTGGDWVGPGHCSVVDKPGAGDWMVYHAWRAGHVNGPGDGRLTLVDAIDWSSGWPTLVGAPSSRSRALP